MHLEAAGIGGTGRKAPSIKNAYAADYPFPFCNLPLSQYFYLHSHYPLSHNFLALSSGRSNCLLTFL